VVGAFSQPPDMTLAPITTAMTAIPDTTPSAGRHAGVVALRRRPR
jgi:hypothetical protein